MQITGAGPAAPDRSRTSTPANAAAAATRFEALVMGEMLTAMRRAKLGDGLFDSGAGRQWRDLQDRMIADHLARQSPLGLAATLSGPSA